jgi:hypothetical protein
MPILSARCARRNGRSASRGMNLRILRAKSDGHLKRGNPRIKLVATRRQSIQPTADAIALGPFLLAEIPRETIVLAR